MVNGDVVLLLNTTDGLMDFVRKTIVSVVQVKKVFTGWFISVERAHLFLTKTTSTNNESFVSIEHNGPACPVGCCSASCPTCPKSEPQCSGPVWAPTCNGYSGICYS